MKAPMGSISNATLLFLACDCTVSVMEKICHFTHITLPRFHFVDAVSVLFLIHVLAVNIYIFLIFFFFMAVYTLKGGLLQADVGSVMKKVVRKHTVM